MLAMTQLVGFGAKESDPYWDKVELLIHGWGPDTSTAIVDSSGRQRAITVVGNAQIDTAQSKFNGSSILFDGSGDKLQVADSASMELGTSDFTVEFWVRFAGLSGSQSLFTKRINNGANGAPIAIYCASGTIYLALQSAPTWNIVVNSAIGVPSINTWYHVAVCRQGSTFYKWFGGASGGTVSSALSLEDVSSPWNIGDDDPSGSGTVGLNGWMADLRVTKGIARYTAAFTPPDRPFQDH